MIRQTMGRRLGAAALAITVGLGSMGALVPAIALAESSTVTISFDSGSYTSQTYTAYQIFASQSASGSTIKVVTWGNGISSTEDFVSALAQSSVLVSNGEHDFTESMTAAEVAEVLANYASGSEKAQAFADVAAQYATQNEIEVKATADDARLFQAEVETGYYLIKSTGATGGESVTDFILQVSGSYDGEAKGLLQFRPKSSTISSDKDITDTDRAGEDATDASIGDKIGYGLTVTLPDNLLTYKTYWLNYVDTLDAGLTLDADSIVVTLVRGNDTYVLDSSAYTVKYAAVDDEAETSKHTLTVLLTELRQALALEDGGTVTPETEDQIVVSYKATLNANAVIGSEGNHNTFHVEYNNDPNTVSGYDVENPPENPPTTPDDDNVVFTYELDNTKIDKDDSETVLSGAQFELRRTVEVNDNEVTQYAILDESNKVSGWTTDESEATHITSGDDGTFNILGLDSGEYDLVEIVAPAGYTVPTDNVFTFTISASIDGEEEPTNTNQSRLQELIITGEDGEPNQGETETGVVRQSIQNSSEAELPSTGGIGTVAFTTVGVALMAGAVTITVMKRRRVDAQE